MTAPDPTGSTRSVRFGGQTWSGSIHSVCHCCCRCYRPPNAGYPGRTDLGLLGLLRFDFVGAGYTVSYSSMTVRLCRHWFTNDGSELPRSTSVRSVEDRVEQGRASVLSRWTFCFCDGVCEQCIPVTPAYSDTSLHRRGDLNCHSPTQW